MPPASVSKVCVHSASVPRAGVSAAQTNRRQRMRPVVVSKQATWAWGRMSLRRMATKSRRAGDDRGPVEGPAFFRGNPPQQLAFGAKVQADNAAGRDRDARAAAADW